MSESDDRPLWDTRPRRSRHHQNPVADVPNLIRQEEIFSLIQLRNCYRECWDSIRQRLLNEAEVEPGRHHVRIEVNWRVRFSQRNLRRLMGDAWVEEKLEEIPPERRREMKIDEGIGQGPPGD